MICRLEIGLRFLGLPTLRAPRELAQGRAALEKFPKAHDRVLRVWSGLRYFLCDGKIITILIIFHFHHGKGLHMSPHERQRLHEFPARVIEFPALRVKRNAAPPGTHGCTDMALADKSGVLCD